MWVKVYAPGTRKGNSCWIARGRDLYGRDFERSLPQAKNEEAARRGADACLRALNSHPPPPVEEPQPEDRSFRAAAEKYKAWRNPSKTETGRIDKLVAVLGNTLAEACGQDEIVIFAREHFPGRKASTLNREALRPYAAILHYAHNPLKWRDWIKLKAFIEEEVDRPAADPADIATLMANADRTGTYKPHHYSHKHGPRIDRNAPYKFALLELLHARALRLTDNLRLKREEDLDLPNGLVRARIGKARGKIKWLPLPAHVVATLATLPACDGGYVFPWRTRSGVYKWLRPLRQKLGISFTPHQVRHLLATEALELEIDERIVQEMGAWASRKSLRPYQKVAQRLMREADNKRQSLPPARKRDAR